MTQATRCVAAHEVDGVAFSPDGKSVAITSSGFSSAVQLFGIDSGAARWKNSRLRASSEVSFSADGSLLCVGGWKAAILDAGDGHVVMWGPDSPSDDVVRTSISPGGTQLITVREREVRVFDVRSGAETHRFHLSSKQCHCVRYSPGGTLATLGEDGIQVWDAVFGELLARLQVPENTNQMQFGGCSHVLVTAARNDSVIRVWDVTSGTLTGLCDTGPSNRWLTLGDGSGRVALTRSADRTLRVWDVASGQERTRLPLGCSGSAASSTATRRSWLSRAESRLRSGRSRAGLDSRRRPMLPHQSAGAAVAAPDNRRARAARHPRGCRPKCQMPLTVTPNATRVRT